ncbi:MAG: pilus assembly protein PilM [Dehalococcoidales bacterium]|nr:pilus assembly protein PilM [Dehalococcoidales bacterium]
MSVTLDISANSLKLVSISGNKVEKWGTAPLAQGWVRDGHILQPQEVANAIDGLFKSLRITKTGVSVTITGLSFTYRFLQLPRLKSSLIEESILRAARKEIPIPLEEVYLSWKIVGGDKEEIEVFLAGVSRNLIDALVQTLKIAGVRPLAIDLKSLALARVANRANTLVVNFEPDCFDIVLVANGMPSILHTVAPRGVTATLEDNVKRLLDDLSRTVDFYNITHAADPIQPATPLLFAGSLVNDPATVELIRNNTDYPLEVMSSTVKVSPDFSVPAYAGNIGLALKGVNRRVANRGDKNRFYDIDIDFMESKRVAETHRTPMGQVVSMLGIIVAVGLLILLSMGRSQAHAERLRLQEEVDALTRELNLIRTAADEAANTEATIQELLAEIETLETRQQQVLGKDVNDADIMGLISSLSVKTPFTAIEIEPDRITIDGEASTKADVVSYAEALGEDPRFSEVRIARISELSGGGSDTNQLSYTIVISF